MGINDGREKEKMNKHREVFAPNGSARKIIRTLDEIICRCPKCRGTLDRNKMCPPCLMADTNIEQLLNAPAQGREAYPDAGCSALNGGSHAKT